MEKNLTLLNKILLHFPLDYVPKPSSSDDSDDTAETEDLFNLSTDISCKSVEGQRVHQMAMIFRNLSFEEGNMFYMSINAVFYR